MSLSDASPLPKDGRAVLPGNPTPVPVLGSTVMFRCVATAPQGSSDQMCVPSSAGASRHHHGAVIVGPETKISLVLPGG